jgi:hypothetical protein
MHYSRFAGPLAAAVLAAACAATPPPLSLVDAQALNIASIEVVAPRDPYAISWPQAEEQFRVETARRAAPPGVSERTYVREKAAATLRRALQTEFADGPHGPRQVRLRVAIVHAHVVNDGEKVLGSLIVGSTNHTLQCHAAFIDAGSGEVIAQTKELGAVENATGAGVVGLVAGAIIEGARDGEPYGRLSAKYAQTLHKWIVPPQR